MTTGYTETLYDGEQSFADFALACARAFGALVAMIEAATWDLDQSGKWEAVATPAPPEPVAWGFISPETGDFIGVTEAGMRRRWGAPPEPDLDVERLARAIEREIHVDVEHGFPPQVDAAYLAAAIADHYDHLAARLLQAPDPLEGRTDE